MPETNPSSSARQKVIAYERVSTKQQDIKRQAVQREYAQAHYPDRKPEVIQDDGVSASKVPIFNRPGGGRMCEMIERGEVEAIYTDAQDRLHRGKQSEWWNFVDLCQIAGTRIVIDGREIDFDNEGDELKSALDAMIARRESLTKSRRLPESLRERVSGEKGEVRCPPIPATGYTRTKDGPLKGRWVRDPDWVPVVERIMRALAEGDEQQVVAQRFNDEGLLTPKGRKWQQSSIRAIAVNHAYIGKHLHKDVVYDCQHEPLIDEATWQAVQAGIGGRGKPDRRGNRPTIPCLFTKPFQLFCGECGLPMNPVNGRYVCMSKRLHGAKRTCTMPSIPHAAVDPWAVDYAIWFAADQKATRADIAAALSGEGGRVRAERERAERDVLDATRKIHQAEEDYFSDDPDKKISGASYEKLTAKHMEQHEAATAKAEQLRKREREVEEAAELVDADDELERRVKAVRRAAGAPIRETLVRIGGKEQVIPDDPDLEPSPEGLRALAAQMSELFDGFELHRGDDVPESEPLPTFGFDVGEDRYTLRPRVRDDALARVPLKLPASMREHGYSESCNSW
jgi:DNA invertase Pin-like site-specific DNA recombinase